MFDLYRTGVTWRDQNLGRNVESFTWTSPAMLVKDYDKNDFGGPLSSMALIKETDRHKICTMTGNTLILISKM